MSSNDHPNNARLRELIDASDLSLATVMTLFNRGRPDPITESILKAWLAPPGSPRWCEVPDEQREHAEKVFSSLKK